MATFVHIGDVHLHPGPRNVDRLRSLDQIISENITREDLAAWLIPGDLFHARSSISDRNELAERLVLMGGRAPVCLLYGNHDVPGDLDVFAKLAAAWPIHVVARPTVLRLTLATSQVASVFCLPYPTEAGLVAQGVAPGEIVQTARVALEAIFVDAGERLARARADGDITLAVGHVNVSGSIVSTGQPSIGKEIELDAALIARLGPCYVGLNHIHVAQDIGGAWYPGSICRLDFGETHPKGYLLVHYANATTFGVETVPIAVPPMFHVEGWLSRDGFTDVQVKAGPDGAVLETPTSWSGCEVRVRAKFHKSEKALLEMAKAHVYAEFAEAARFELELVAVPDTALRAPEVAAARTTAEKVQAWATETKTVFPADVLAVLPALEHGDTFTLLASEREMADALLGVDDKEPPMDVGVLYAALLLDDGKVA